MRHENDPTILKAIRAIVDYNLSDEAEDYEHMVAMGEIEEGDELHIYTQLRRVEEWLNAREARTYIVDRCYDTPGLIGPFAGTDDAETYAEKYHPEDEDGGVWILQAVPPLDDEEAA